MDPTITIVNAEAHAEYISTDFIGYQSVVLEYTASRSN